MTVILYVSKLNAYSMWLMTMRGGGEVGRIKVAVIFILFFVHECFSDVFSSINFVSAYTRQHTYVDPESVIFLSLGGYEPLPI